MRDTKPNRLEGGWAGWAGWLTGGRAGKGEGGRGVGRTKLWVRGCPPSSGRKDPELRDVKEVEEKKKYVGEKLGREKIKGSRVGEGARRSKGREWSVHFGKKEKLHGHFFDEMERKTECSE